MSMISASGAIRLITPWQVPTKSSWSPKSDRNVITIGGTLRRSLDRRPPDGLDQPVEIVRLSLGDDVDAGCLRGARRLGPDRDGGQLKPERGEGLGGRGRGQ